MGIEKLNELKDKMAQIKAEIAVEGKKAFHEACTELFEANPKLESFSWEQSTPYFNDGDPCVFHVYADEINMTFDGHDLEYVWFSHCAEAPEGEGVEDVEDQDALLKAFKDIKKITSFLMSNEDVALDAFGDHARVAVSRDGVEVEEYDHE